jgi:transcription-repair coupling factor (superfamily II helicase)
MPDLRSLLQPVFDHPAFRAACAAVELPPAAGRRGPTLSGLTRTAKALFAAGLAHQLRRPLIVLTANNETADRLRRTAATILEWLEPGAGASVNVLPAVDSTPYEGRSPHPEISERRAVALWNLAHGRSRALFVPIPAALGRFREKAYYGSLALELKVGDEVILEDLMEHLQAVGYEPGEPVSGPGQFSVRGGIVDIFPPEVAWPLRLEFFGDRIESLRAFDPNTQRSRERTTAALLLPFAETRRSPRLFERLVEVLAARQKLKGEPDWAAEYSSSFPGWEFFAPLVEPRTQTLPALMERPLLIWDEPVERLSQLQRTYESWAAAYDEVRDVVPPRPRPEEVLLSQEEFLKSVEVLPQISVKELAVEDAQAAGESLALCLATSPHRDFMAP